MEFIMKRLKPLLPEIFRAFTFILVLALGWAVIAAEKEKQSPYYQKEGHQLFNPHPKEDSGRPWRVRNFGPVGIGIDLKAPGMTMEISHVEKGSPADATGKLKKGQVIESINGTVLRDIDPRIILGNLITEAEATDGKINLKIAGFGEVLVEIPVMGAYCETWPLNCPKSDKIVRQLAEVVARDEKPKWGSVLFLLSTGEEKDLAVVRKWMKNIETIGGMNWEKGYKGPGLCEYYLRTGDQSVLPVIRRMTEELKENLYNGGWSGRGKPAAFTYSTGTGQVHASGMHCLTFLLMARLCGVEVDEYMFGEALQQFYRFAGHGNVAYGNGLPEGGFRDNGKTSGLAVAMAVAAQLSPEGESSVYADARDNSAMKSFYATNWFHAAHTGGGMGEIWHHGAMNLMREKRPIPYRSYFDTRRWVMDLSRRFDGSIGIAGMDDRYDRSHTEASGGRAWGTYFALTYTYPRKKLQIWGAPRSKWAHHFELPARPWGNATDDLFQSPEPIAGGREVNLTMADLQEERVESDSSVPVIDKLTAPDLDRKTLLKYVLHPEYDLRSMAMDQVVRRGWVDLVVPLLESPDPRLRQAGLLTLTGMFKGRPFPDNQLTPEMFDLVSAMIENPDESWWVALHAIRALERADPERIVKLRDRLLEFLEYDSVWLQTAAVTTLTRIATTPPHHQVVFPAVLDRAASFTVDAASSRALRAIVKAVSSAPPGVKAFCAPLIKRTYVGIPNQLTDPGSGAVMSRGAKTVRARVGEIVRQVPGGEEFVRRIPKTTVASHKSGRDLDRYVYQGKFTPNKRIEGTWAWAVWPQPKRPEEVDDFIKRWLKPRLGKSPTKMERIKDTLKLEKGGKVSKSNYYRGYFWSDDMLIGVNEDLALKMEVRTVEGVEFLVVEKNKFESTPNSDEVGEIPEDWHPGYHIYVRQN